MADIDISEIQRKTDALLAANPTVKVYLKWTCPTCGERVTATEPNSYCLRGYYHEEKDDGSSCGALYTGTKFGMLLLFAVGGKAQ